MKVIWLFMFVHIASSLNGCFDCKYYIKNGRPDFGKCSLFTKPPGGNVYCSTARLNQDMCGKGALLFEPKPKPTFSYFSLSANV